MSKKPFSSRTTPTAPRLRGLSLGRFAELISISSVSFCEPCRKRRCNRDLPLDNHHRPEMNCALPSQSAFHFESSKPYGPNLTHSDLIRGTPTDGRGSHQFTTRFRNLDYSETQRRRACSLFCGWVCTRPAPWNPPVGLRCRHGCWTIENPRYFRKLQDLDDW